MIDGLRVFFRSVGDVWFNLIGYATCNLIVLAGFALVLPGPPLLMGFMQVAAESLPYAERPEVGSLLRHTRRHALTGWKLALLQLPISFVIAISFLFYYNAGTAWSVPLIVVTGAVGWTWLGVVLYSAPLLLRSERGVLVALRNGLVAMLHYPFFTSTLLLLLIPIIAVSLPVLPLLALFTLSLYVVVANRATMYVLRKEGLLPPEERDLAMDG